MVHYRPLYSSPVIRNGVFYLRVSVPADLAKVAKGKIVTLPIGGGFNQVTIGTHVKTSLQTRDPSEAKRRHITAYCSLDDFWDALRGGPRPMSHKELLSIAGEIRRNWIAVFDQEPGPANLWKNVLLANDAAVWGGKNRLRLTIPGPSSVSQTEERFGPMTDGYLRRHRIHLHKDNRLKLRHLVAEGLIDAARINELKAGDDYSDSGETS